MNNRLKTFVQKKVDKMNAKKAKREKKWSVTQELKWCAEQMSVSYNSVLAWYLNRIQPEDTRKPALARLYGSSYGRFYYEKIQLNIKSPLQIHTS